jgi:hypothetical protein
MTAPRLSNVVTLVVLPLATAILGGGIGSYLTYRSANREMDVKMVEIAVGILSQEPKENIAPAREWAVDVIDYYAEVKPSSGARKALINNQAVIPPSGAMLRTDSFGGATPPQVTTGSSSRPNPN